jgi:hypothetical protein
MQVRGAFIFEFIAVSSTDNEANNERFASLDLHRRERLCRSHIRALAEQVGLPENGRPQLNRVVLTCLILTL